MKLTAAEYETLARHVARLWGYQGDAVSYDADLFHAVEEIITARLRPIEALVESAQNPSRADLLFRRSTLGLIRAADVQAALDPTRHPISEGR